MPWLYRIAVARVAYGLSQHVVFWLLVAGHMALLGGIWGPGVMGPGRNVHLCVALQ